MEYKTAHFLKMSGVVPLSKRREFEQTFRFVSNQLPPDCLQCNISADESDAGLYHFYSLWTSAESRDRFLKSPECQVLEGAYQALGTLEQSIIGEQMADVKLFNQ
ncbi:MAG TPA: hypothetical protein VFV68_11415 [Agriterribacter sp.]|nr:hypothetical protein [Agriterribacter sp.]